MLYGVDGEVDVVAVRYAILCVISDRKEERLMTMDE